MKGKVKRSLIIISKSSRSLSDGKIKHGCGRKAIFEIVTEPMVPLHFSSILAPETIPGRTGHPKEFMRELLLSKWTCCWSTLCRLSCLVMTTCLVLSTTLYALCCRRIATLGRSRYVACERCAVRGSSS